MSKPNFRQLSAVYGRNKANDLISQISDMIHNNVSLNAVYQWIAAEAEAIERRPVEQQTLISICCYWASLVSGEELIPEEQIKL